MAQMQSIYDFPARDRISLEQGSLFLIPCDSEVHGALIRELTKENFYDLISRTIGWNQELHQQEPRFPDRYRMVTLNGVIIGFFAVGQGTDYLYLYTIQLISSFRGKGYGTALLDYLENFARSKGFQFLRLSVFEGNPTQRLYQGWGYCPIEAPEGRGLILMQKDL